jgi:predicted nuclease of predicted toxin-antitoxin system
MRVLFDECMPERLRHDIAKLSARLTIETARYAGLAHLSNGALLAAMAGRYDALVTVDKNLRYQQNMTGRTVSVVVITSVNNDIDLIRPVLPAVAAALAIIPAGDVVEV